MTAYRDQSEVIFPVVQNAHGFNPGQALRRDTTVWVKALADTSANGSMVGVVDRVINANTFYLRLTGKITGLSGLTSGTTYYLSTTTPGALTPTAPSTVGQLYRPVLVADSATSGYVYNDGGMVVGTGPPGPPGPPGPGGDITTSPIWDAKGDLAVGTGPDASTRLAAGTQGFVLLSDSVQTAGLGWRRPLDVCNVKTEYGATGNGTTNDQPAIQNAINAIAPTGGDIFLPAGAYRINTALDFSACNATWRTLRFHGAGGVGNIQLTGGDSTRILNYAGTSAIKAIGTSDSIYPYIQLEGFMIYVQASMGTNVPAIDLQGVREGYLLRDLTISFPQTSFTGDGIRATKAQYGWVIERCNIGAPASGRPGGGFVLTGGRLADGTLINANLADEEWGNGSLISCCVWYAGGPAFDIVGMGEGVGLYSCKSVACDPCGLRVLGMCNVEARNLHIEGGNTGIQLGPQLPNGVPASHCSIHANVSYSYTMVDCNGTDNDVQAQYFTGSANVGVAFGTEAKRNVVRLSIRPNFGATVTTWATDNSSTHDNVVWVGGNNLFNANSTTPKPPALRLGRAPGAFQNTNEQPLELHQVSGYGGVSMSTWSADWKAPVIDFQKSRSATSGTHAMVVADDSLGQIVFAGSDGTRWVNGALIAAAVDGVAASYDMPGRLVFYTTPDGLSSPSERMRIDNAGHILVNAQASYGRGGQRLEAHTSAADEGGLCLTNWSATGGNAPILDMQHSKSDSVGTQAASANADILGHIYFRGSDGTQFVTGVLIRATAEGAGASANVPARLSLYTNAGAGATERLRLDAKGNVVIGTGQLPASATDGFLYLPNIGTTGTPTAYTGRTPIAFDASSAPGRIYAYVAGGWHYVAFTA
jgi:hypothetical protein